MDSTQIELKGSVTIRQVSELYAEVKEAVSAGNLISFDLAEIKAVDAAALQLLIAGSKHTHSDGSGVEFIDLPESLIELFQENGAGQLVPDEASEPTAE